VIGKKAFSLLLFPDQSQTSFSLFVQRMLQ